MPQWSGLAKKRNLERVFELPDALGVAWEPSEAPRGPLGRALGTLRGASGNLRLPLGRFGAALGSPRAFQGAPGASLGRPGKCSGALGRASGRPKGNLIIIKKRLLFLSFSATGAVVQDLATPLGLQSGSWAALKGAGGRFGASPGTPGRSSGVPSRFSEALGSAPGSPQERLWDPRRPAWSH